MHLIKSSQQTTTFQVHDCQRYKCNSPCFVGCGSGPREKFPLISDSINRLSKFQTWVQRKFSTIYATFVFMLHE